MTNRWLTYFFTTCKGYTLIHQRKSADIWQQLYEFPLVESKQELSSGEQDEHFRKQFGFENFHITSSVGKQQKLTHQLIVFNLLKVEVEQMNAIADYKWIKISELDQYAFPKTLQQYNAGIFNSADQVAGR